MTQTLDKKIILIVEDDEIISELIQEIIHELGYSPVYIKNGHEAISWLRNNIPDLMVLDYALPDMNAAILISLLSHENENIPPFIISTGMGDEFIAVDMMKRGARDYLVKNSQFLSNLPLVINRIIRELDIEKRLYRTQGELQESQERLRTLIDTIPDLICFKNKEGGILEANKFFLKLFDLKNEDYMYKNNYQLADLSPNYKDYFLNQNETDEQTWLCKSPYRIRETIKQNNNQEIVLDTIKIPMFYNDGSRKGIIIVGRDISDILKNIAERKNIEEKALKSQKLESLGVLAGGIAHDFNNLLTVILGHTDLAIHFTNPDTNIYNSLKEIENSSKRAAELCQQMLAYSGKGKFFVQAINLNYALKNLNSMISSSINKKITIETDLNNRLPIIEGDSNQIQQLIINLLINASEAIGDKSGLIKIKTSFQYCDKNFIEKCIYNSEPNPAVYSYISIYDNGSGINEKLLDKIFEPFYSTKFTGRGLGLSAVLGIVKSHKGLINIDSVENNHTEISIYFPALDQNVNPEESQSDEILHFNLDGEILLVDDEVSILNTGKEILEYLGFNVIAIDDSNKALEFFRENHHKIIFSIIDLSMPIMDGYELLNAFNTIKSDNLALITSGYNEANAISRFDKSHKIAFLQKPYSLAEVSSKINEFLSVNKLLNL